MITSSCAPSSDDASDTISVSSVCATTVIGRPAKTASPVHEGPVEIGVYSRHTVSAVGKRTQKELRDRGLSCAPLLVAIVIIAMFLTT